MRLYKVPDWKCDVVPNGVVPTEYQMEVDPEEVKRSYGLNPSSPLILYTGRLEYQKGPDLLLETISQVYNYHGDVQAIIAGAGCMQQYLQERAKDLPVKFVGYIPDTEYIRLLNACDLAVIPSRNEPFGLVLLEAWSANRCVIASNVGGLSENIDTFVNGLMVWSILTHSHGGSVQPWTSRQVRPRWAKKGEERLIRCSCGNQSRSR